MTIKNFVWNVMVDLENKSALLWKGIVWGRDLAKKKFKFFVLKKFR